MEEAGLTLDSDEIRTPNPDGWFYTGKEWRCVLWAENWPAMKLYTTIMATQWIHGFNGPTGLNYMVLFHELDRLNLPPDDYDDLFGSIREIERAALHNMRSSGT